MIRVVLAWLAFCPAQDPDRSTPEKTCDAFFALGQKFEEDGNAWFKIVREVDTLADFCRTEEFKAKAAKKNEEWEKMSASSKTLSAKQEIVSKTEEKDGSVSVEVKQTFKRSRKSPDSEKPEESEDIRTNRIVLQKVGANWLVHELYRPCFMCNSAGTCSYCQGTGKSGDQDCTFCEGKKQCKECKGEKMKKEDFTDVKLQLIIAEGEFKYSTDLSSPKAAAQTYVDLLTRQGIEMGTKLKAYMDGMVVKMKDFFTPEVLKSVDAAMANAVEQGKKRFKEDQAKLDSVEEKGDAAYATVVTKVDWGEQKERKQRMVFKKVGDKWLVDGEQNPCWGCQGSGKCGSCQGTGKAGETDCYGCQGKKGCTSCNGAGWMSDQP